jgi:hypothetical protein
MSLRRLDLGDSFGPELVKKYEQPDPLPEYRVPGAEQLISRTAVQKTGPSCEGKKKTPAAKPKPSQKLDFNPALGSLVTRQILSKQQLFNQAPEDQDPPKKRRLAAFQSVPMDATAINAALEAGK